MRDILALSPRATRDGKKIEEKFRFRTLKAWEKFKVEEEILATRRAKFRTHRRSTTQFSGAMGMYIIDTEEGAKITQSLSTVSLQYPSIKENIMLVIIKFFKSMYAESKCELKWRELMAIMVCLQTPMTYIIRQVNMITQWGALPVLILHFLIKGCLGMPIFMVFMFLGNYARKSYIQFWECVPALKGLAYSIMITSMQHQIYNVIISSVSLSYILNVFSSSEYPWKNCQFKGNSPSCYHKPPVRYNVSCCNRGEPNCTKAAWSATIFKYSPYDYFITNQLQLDFKDIDDIKKPMPLKYMGYAALIWGIIFLMLMIGLKKFRGVLTTINLITAAIVFGPILMFTIYYGDQLMFRGLISNYNVMFNYTFILAILRHSLDREYAGDVITYSAHSSPGISSGVNTICIYTIKLLGLLLATVWASMGATIVQKHYNIQDPKCIDLNGFTFLFAIMPHLITQLHFPKLMILIYFSMIFMWTFSGAVYGIYSFVGALMEEYPKLIKFKGLVCSSICIICCAVNLLVIQGNLLKIYTTWLNETYIKMKVGLVVFSLLGIFLYNTNRLSDDYHFTYGQKLNRFWIYGLKVSILLISISLVVFFAIKCTSLDVSLLDVFMTCIVLVPVVSGILISFARYKAGLRKTFINPDTKWGPFTYTKRIARSKFDPKRALRHRSTGGLCKHSCLLYSNLLRKEILYWEEEYLKKQDIEIEEEESSQYI